MKINCAEIISVGTELLMGDIVNTNAAYIAKELTKFGVNVFHQVTVGDNAQRLKTAFSEGIERADAVIATGGLGPTYDDITKQVAVDVLGDSLTFHKPSWDEIEKFFENLGRVPTENNKSQAFMPTNGDILDNPNGTAPGCVVYNKDKSKCIVLLPGPPREMKPMFDKWSAKYLADKIDGSFYSNNLHFFGVGESDLSFHLNKLMEGSTNPTIAPYAKTGEVMLRVTACAKSEEEAKILLEKPMEEINKVAGEFLYGININTLEQAVVEYFFKHNITCGTAESCTGGLVSERITQVSGASSVLAGGIVSYTNQIKSKVLGVEQQLLEEYGAVSAPVAQAMAKNAREVLGCDVAVSVTGNAGPNPSEGKDVGTVFVAVDSQWHSEVVQLNLMRRDENLRQLIKYLAASNCLNLLLKTAKIKYN